MPRIYHPPSGKGTLTGGALIGIIVSGLIFLAIPLTQIFTSYRKAPEEIEALEMAPPPPPPPIEEPPPPPEPEEEEPPPELEAPPPPISLEQLEMALNPGTGGNLGGDFALPTFDVSQKDLGGLEIFDIMDLDDKPTPKRQGAPAYPASAKRKGLEGFALAEFVIDEFGNVTEVEIMQSSDPVFEKPTIEAIRKWTFTPGKKDGRVVRTRTRVRLPFRIE